MIKKITMRNFRGVEKANLDLAPITVLTGPNNSGKSTLMYGLLALRNIATNPNQPLDSFFNFVFMNLGGFKESVFLKEDDSRKIVLAIESERGPSRSSYRVELGKAQSSIKLEGFAPAQLSMALDVTFPYALNSVAGAILGEDFNSAKITWNGVAPTVALAPPTSVPPPTAPAEAPTEEDLKKLNTSIVSEITLPIRELKAVDFVPLKRGFTKPIFSPVPLQAQLLTEDEIATFIANDRDLEASVSFYLEKVVDKNFQARPTLGTASFYLQTTDRETGFLCDLVNDGFGTNETVYLLAKALRKDQRLICIEEPEIHLHPGALIRLLRALVDIAKEKNRSFLISTHSEHLVVELLNSVIRGSITPEELRIYYVRREKAKTIVEEQRVNDKGQLDGGLKAFYGTELEQMKAFIEAAPGK